MRPDNPLRRSSEDFQTRIDALMQLQASDPARFEQEVVQAYMDKHKPLGSAKRRLTPRRMAGAAIRNDPTVVEHQNVLTAQIRNDLKMYWHFSEQANGGGDFAGNGRMLLASLVTLLHEAADGSWESVVPTEDQFYRVKPHTLEIFAHGSRITNDMAAYNMAKEGDDPDTIISSFMDATIARISDDNLRNASQLIWKQYGGVALDVIALERTRSVAKNAQVTGREHDEMIAATVLPDLSDIPPDIEPLRAELNEKFERFNEQEARKEEQRLEAQKTDFYAPNITWNEFFKGVDSLVLSAQYGDDGLHKAKIAGVPFHSFMQYRADDKLKPMGLSEYADHIGRFDYAIDSISNAMKKNGREIDSGNWAEVAAGMTNLTYAIIPMFARIQEEHGSVYAHLMEEIEHIEPAAVQNRFRQTLKQFAPLIDELATCHRFVTAEHQTKVASGEADQYARVEVSIDQITRALTRFGNARGKDIVAALKESYVEKAAVQISWEVPNYIQSYAGREAALDYEAMRENLPRIAAMILEPPSAKTPEAIIEQREFVNRFNAQLSGSSASDWLNGIASLLRDPAFHECVSAEIKQGKFYSAPHGTMKGSDGLMIDKLVVQADAIERVSTLAGQEIDNLLAGNLRSR